MLTLALLQGVREGFLERRVHAPLETHGGILGEHRAADVQAEAPHRVLRQPVAHEARQLRGDAPPHLVDVRVGDLLRAARGGQQDHEGVAADHDLRDVVLAAQRDLLDLEEERRHVAHQRLVALPPQALLHPFVLQDADRQQPELLRLLEHAADAAEEQGDGRQVGDVVVQQVGQGPGGAGVSELAARLEVLQELLPACLRTSAHLASAVVDVVDDLLRPVGEVLGLGTEDPVPPLLLGAVQGGVGGLDEVGAAAPVVREGRDAAAQ